MREAHSGHLSSMVMPVCLCQVANCSDEVVTVSVLLAFDAAPWDGEEDALRMLVNGLQCSLETHIGHDGNRGQQQQRSRPVSPSGSKPGLRMLAPAQGHRYHVRTSVLREQFTPLEGLLAGKRTYVLKHDVRLPNMRMRMENAHAIYTAIVTAVDQEVPEANGKPDSEQMYSSDMIFQLNPLEGIAQPSDTVRPTEPIIAPSNHSGELIRRISNMSLNVPVANGPSNSRRKVAVFTAPCFPALTFHLRTIPLQKSDSLIVTIDYQPWPRIPMTVELTDVSVDICSKAATQYASLAPLVAEEKGKRVRLLPHDILCKAYRLQKFAPSKTAAPDLPITVRASCRCLVDAQNEVWSQVITSEWNIKVSIDITGQPDRSSVRQSRAANEERSSSISSASDAASAKPKASVEAHTPFQPAHSGIEVMIHYPTEVWDGMPFDVTVSITNVSPRTLRAMAYAAWATPAARAHHERVKSLPPVPDDASREGSIAARQSTWDTYARTRVLNTASKYTREWSMHTEPPPVSALQPQLFLGYGSRALAANNAEPSTAAVGSRRSGAL